MTGKIEVLLVMSMKMAVLWDAVSFNLIDDIVVLLGYDGM
jgi:hypothetical protein